MSPIRKCLQFTSSHFEKYMSGAIIIKLMSHLYSARHIYTRIPICIAFAFSSCLILSDDSFSRRSTSGYLVIYLAFSQSRGDEVMATVSFIGYAHYSLRRKIGWRNKGDGCSVLVANPSPRRQDDDGSPAASDNARI